VNICPTTHLYVSSCPCPQPIWPTPTEMTWWSNPTTTTTSHRQTSVAIAAAATTTTMTSRQRSARSRWRHWAGSRTGPRTRRLRARLDFL